MVIIQMIYALHRTPKQSPRPVDIMTAWSPIIQKDVDESNVDEKNVLTIFTHYNDTPAIISGNSLGGMLEI